MKLYYLYSVLKHKPFHIRTIKHIKCLQPVYEKCDLSSILSVCDISRHQDRICRHYDPDELKKYPGMQIYHLGHDPSWMVAKRLGYRHQDLESYRVETAKRIIRTQKEY